jgi:2-polyprenyl-3-methyl-5-hydroxy-6-metoxy-1,4-benzoquinol methylase
LSRQSPVRSIVNRIAPPLAAGWLDIPGLRRDSRILDVGCGNGMALRQLAEGGFTNLTGVDPFLPDTVQTPPRVRMIRGEMGDVDGQYDYIMFHHSLEHIEDQRGAIAAAAERLSRGGCLLIRVPTVSSWAWKHYREHWYQVDAPRHFVLHSVESLTQLGERAGLRVERIRFDSNETQILWSDAYARGVAMPEASPFSRSDVARARTEAARLNMQGQGDQIAAYFRKA